MKNIDQHFIVETRDLINRNPTYLRKHSKILTKDLTLT